MKKEISKERVSRIISVLLQSPNNSVSRAGLWCRLIKLREKL